MQCIRRHVLTYTWYMTVTDVRLQLSASKVEAIEILRRGLRAELVE